jgi:very-short-patch-repair endonuclease
MATSSAQHKAEAENETAPFMCRKCERAFAFRSEYDRHLKNVYPCVRPGASRYSCDACKAEFDLKTRYDQHLRTKKHLRRVQANETGECDASEAAEASPTLPESIHVEGMRSGIRLSQGGMLSAHDLVMQACDVTKNAALRLVMNMCTTVTIHVGPLSGSDHDDHFLVDALGAALIMRVLGAAGQGFRDEFGERLLIAMGADDVTRASLHEPIDYFDDTDDDADDGANIGTDDGTDNGTEDLSDPVNELGDTVTVDAKFKHNSDAICSSLGYARKDNLVKILKRDYQANVDWICITSKRSSHRRAYYLTDECLRMLVYRCSSRCIARSVSPVKLGDTELHHVRRYHPKEEELIGFLMRVYSRKHSCHVQQCLGPYRVDMLIDDRIVVECNENNHAGYDQVKEAERLKYIETKGYTIYGFDCDSPTFDLATVVADLNDLL